MEFVKNIIPQLVPLFQTLIWFILIGALLIYLRKDIELLRKEVIRRIQEGGSVKIGGIDLGQLTRRVEDAEMEIDIAKSFIMSMNDKMYLNLKKIASGDFGPYELEVNSGLWRELYHLRDVGYIEVHAIRSIPTDGKNLNLSDYVKITEVGQSFVALREKYIANKDALHK